MSGDAMFAESIETLQEIMILFDIISYFSTNSIKTLTLTPDFYIVVF